MFLDEIAQYPSSAARRHIIDAYKAGSSGPVIARQYDTSKETIYNVLRAEGVDRRRPSEASRRYQLDVHAFDTITPESAYWVGVLMADGCVRYQPNATLQYGAAAVDRGHVEAFRDFLKSTHPFRCRPPRPTSGFGGSSDYCEIVVPSAVLVAAVARYGVLPRKSLTAKIVGLEDSVDFWRGAIDGDGYLGEYPEVRVGLVGSQALVQQFEHYVYRNIAGVRATTRRKGTIFGFSVNSTLAVRLLSLLYAGTPALARKRDHARSILDRRS